MGPMDGAHELESAVTLHTERLYGIAYNILGSHHDAEDVLQEIWLQFSNSDRAQIRDVVTWLNTVTINRSLTRRERLACRSWIEQREPPQTESAASDSEKESLNGQVGELIASIRPRHREVLEARYYEGRSVREIAERSDSSTSAIQSRLQRALEHVRQRAPRSWRNLIGVFFLPWRRKGEDSRGSSAITAYAATGAVVVGTLAWFGSGAPRHHDLIEPTNAATLATTGHTRVESTERQSETLAEFHASRPVVSEPTAPTTVPNFRVRGSVLSFVRRRPHRDFTVLWAPLDDPENGRVAFSWDGGLLGDFEVNVSEGWLWAEHDGSWPGRRHLVDRDLGRLTLALAGRRPFQSQVLDTLDKPVAHATLRVVSQRHASETFTGSERPPQELFFETDEAGWVSAYLPVGQHSTIATTVNKRVVAFTVFEKDERKLVLDTPASLVLQGIHPEAGPVAGANVDLRIKDAQLSWSAVTDENGTLELNAPPNVPISILIEDPGSGFSAASEVVLQPTAKQQPLLLHLSDNRITGRVESHGRPATGWIVRSLAANDPLGASSVRTDQEGRFELRSDHEGHCTLVLHHPSDDLNALALLENVQRGSDVTWVAPQHRESRIRGWVEFSSNDRNLECWVEVDGPLLTRRLVVPVDDGGEFETRALSPGKYRVSLASRLHGKLEMPNIELKTGKAEVVFYELPALGALEIQIQTELGPGPGEQIFYRLVKDDYERFEWHDGECLLYASSNSWFDKQTKTLAIPDLPPGRYEARISGPFRTIQRSLTIESGKLTSISTEDGAFVKMHLRVLGSVALASNDEVRVEWNSGDGWQELLFGTAPPYSNALVVAQGNFRFRPGEVHFRVETSSGWHANASTELAPGELTRLDLHLKPPD